MEFPQEAVDYLIQETLKEVPFNLFKTISALNELVKYAKSYFSGQSVDAAAFDPASVGLSGSVEDQIVAGLQKLKVDSSGEAFTTQSNYLVDQLISYIVSLVIKSIVNML